MELMSLRVYELSPDKVVHETDVYAVDVGDYPNDPLPCYRVWNKNTGVLEYAHAISFYAYQWADAATKALAEPPEVVAEGGLPGVQ